MKTSKRKGAIGTHLLLLEIVIFCVELLHLRHLVWHSPQVEREMEDAYVYQLKDELLETELIPFLRDFYPLRYQEKKYYEGALESVEACKNLSELKERMETTYDDFDDAFQIIEDSSLSFLSSDSFDRRCFSYSFQNVSLSSNGKILMECYGSFLGFVRRSLCEVFKKYKLIGAIRVWIE